MRTKKHVEELRVHTDGSGVIWFLDGTGSAKSTTLSAGEFAAEDVCRSAEKVRLIGLPANAELVCELYERLQECRATLELGTPFVCQVCGIAEPEAILESMGKLDGLPVSLGGWHRATAADCAAHELVRALENREPYQEALKKHPAYSAVSFIDSHENDAAWMLANILDPRWYVDPSRPGRTARLRSYMGLRSKSVRAVWHREMKGIHGKPSAMRVWLLIDAWTNRARNAPALPALDAPNSFLWRRFHESADDTVKGVLRASAMFLSFVRSVWLDNLTTQELFVPDYFFTRKGDDVAAVDQTGVVAEAYKQHLEQLRGTDKAEQG